MTSWNALHYWPIFTSSWFVMTFVVSYLVAVVGSGNVYFLWPMISDTGALPPESCIFGQLLNMGALFMLITMFVRYKQIDIAIKDGSLRVHRYCNNFCMLTGIAGSLGMSIVANFQVTNVSTVHLIGAIMVFGVGSGYFIIQAGITYLSKDCETIAVDTYIICTRIGISVLLPPLFTSCFACVLIASKHYTGKGINWWRQSTEVFQYRLAAAIMEWAMAIMMIIYTGSFQCDFRSLEFKEITFKNKLSTS